MDIWFFQSQALEKLQEALTNLSPRTGKQRAYKRCAAKQNLLEKALREPDSTDIGRSSAEHRAACHVLLVSTRRALHQRKNCRFERTLQSLKNRSTPTILESRHCIVYISVVRVRREELALVNKDVFEIRRLLRSLPHSFLLNSQGSVPASTE